MSTVNVTVAPIAPAGVSIALRRVRVRLVAGGYGAPGHVTAGEILHESYIDLSTSAAVSVPLVRNNEITPAGTFYEVSIPSLTGAKWWVQLAATTPGTVAVGDPTIQVQSPVGPGVAAGLAIIGPPGLSGAAGPPGDLSVDPTLIDGDVFSGAPDGLLTARRTFRGRSYGDGVGGGPGATVLRSGRLQWGKADGTWPNPVGGASYGNVDLGSAVPDTFGVTAIIRSTTCQGAAASTDGGAFGLICTSNPDAQTDGQQIVLHGAIHITFGRTVWSAGIFDSVHGSGQRDFLTGGVPMTAPFATPLPVDTPLTAWVRRIGDRVQVLLPDGTLITSDPDPQIPILWGPRIVLEPYQPGGTYVTDRRVEYLGWLAKSVSTPVVLDRAAAQSIPRETDGTAAPGRLPAFLQPLLTLASRHGSSGVYASTPDSPAVSITGNIDLRVTVEADTWRPATQGALIAKWGGSYSYLLLLDVSGSLVFYWTADGATNHAATSTVAIPVGTTGALRVRATLQVNNGSAGNTVTFYTSTDGVTWTVLGAAVVAAGVTSVYDGTSPVEVGSNLSGTVTCFQGWVYGAEVRNEIGGPVVAAYVPRYSYVAPTGETWTFNGGFKLVSWRSLLTSADAATLAAGGGGGPPTGTAGGDLAGTYPNPTVPGKLSANDPSVTNARTPTAHAVSHASGGTDAVTVTESQVTGLVTDLAAKADLVGGVLATAQVPPLSITDTFTVGSQAAMLALTAQRGDVAVRTDLSATFILVAEPASTLANWKQLATPTDLVLSVNGQQGAVVLAASDVGAPTSAALTAETSRATAAEGARLVIAQNLADLANAGTARTNLGLGTAATANTGTGAGNAVLGNDARLADVRTPADGSVTDAKVAAGAAIAETKLVLASDAAAGVASRRTLGSGATQAAAGSDSRLSDQRAPLDGSVTTAKVVDGSVTLAKLATVATATIRGRTSAGTGAPEDLTAAQAKTVLAITEADVTNLGADLAVKRELTAYPSGTPASWVGPVRSATFGVSAGSQNRLLASTFEHVAGQQITAVRIYVSAAVAGSSVRVGIWNCDAYGRPTSLLSELGSIPTTTTGWQTLTLGATLTVPGTRSVLGTVAQAGTPTVAVVTPLYEPWYAVVPSTNGGAPTSAVNAWAVSSVTGALPANFPNWAGTAPSSTVAPEAIAQSTVPLVQFLAA